jgi:hypothetical protein
MAIRMSLALTLVLGIVTGVSGAEISGDYLESRTCDVYTGPCFANAQVGVTGQQAFMAWSIERGQHEGVDLAGLKVILAIRASDTLGYGGGMVVHPDPIKSVVLVDERANETQRRALVDFAKQRAGKLKGEVVRISAVPIAMNVDHVDMIARLNAGKEVQLLTRRLAKGDCVCSNEEIYYPPLTGVENSSPAYTVEGGFSGRGLGVRWSNPATRSAYLATFAY